MARLTVGVKGGDRIRRQLEAAAGRLEGALESAVADEALDIVDDERSLVPVDQGELRDGITAVAIDGGMGAEVGPRDPDLYYGVYVEWGRNRAPAQPFATPAAEKSRARFAHRVKQAAKRALDG